MSQHIVCFDPLHRNIPGTILDPAAAHKLASMGAAVLPVDPTLLRENGASGHVQRFFGDAGWEFDGNRPSRGCHMFLSLPAGTRTIHWMAWVRAMDDERAVQGKLKLVADTSRSGSSGLRAIERVDLLPSLPPKEGVAVYGSSAVALSIQATLGLSLHGVCDNATILTAAMTVV